MPSTQTLQNVKDLKPFMSVAQLNIMGSMVRNSEEKEFFIDKLAEMANIVNTMPKTYETDGVAIDDKIIVLHYFYANMDWYIVEKDMEENEPQYQAFGFANIGFGISGLGYIGIDEIITTTPAELDLHWTPCTFAEMKAKKGY